MREDCGQPQPSPARLLLANAVVRAIDAHALRLHPREACGVLLGRSHPARVLRMAPARNLDVARARERYELDPGALVAAAARARAAGLDVIGFWHSHPDAPALHSEHDRRAAWEGFSYLILSVESARIVERRSWRFPGGVPVEEELRLEGEHGVVRPAGGR